MSWRKVRLGDFLTRIKEPVKIKTNEVYSLVTIRMYHKGVNKRADIKGSSIKSTTLYSIKPRQFILSGIDARNRAFGIVPSELDGAVITNDFWTHDINTKLINLDYFYWFTTTPSFYEACIKASEGTTNRQRLQADKFYSFEVWLPSLDEQEGCVKKISEINKQTNFLENELLLQQRYLVQLRQAILQEAVQGKLTKQYKDDEPANVLLKKIKIARDKWIQTETVNGNSEASRVKRKIENAKNEPPNISLPKNWQWATLNETCCLIVDCHNKTAPYSETGIPIIRTGNIKDGSLNKNDLKFVKEDIYIKWSKRCPPVAGDILFTREAPVGEAAIIPDGNKICMGQRIMLIRPFHHLTSKEYLLIALRSNDFLLRLESNHVGMTVKHLRVGDVENAFIALPPLSEQHRIVTKVERLMQMVNQLEQLVTTSQQQAQQLLQAVFKEAFSSKEKFYEENEMITAEGN